MDFNDYKQGNTTKDFWFRGKHDLIEGFLTHLDPFTSPGPNKILDVGGGTGGDLEVLGKFGDVTLVDIHPEALAAVPDHLVAEKRQADICNLPYEDNTFDFAVSFDVFEHIEDDAKAVSEIYRVLKPGGILLMTVPAFPFLFSSHDVALEHKRRYTMKAIKQLLSPFRDLRLYYWNSLLFFPGAVIRIFRKTKKPKVDSMHVPLISDSLYWALSFENKLIRKKISMPVGLTIAGYCRK